MSDYRFQIVKRGEIDCLHVMIDTPGEIAHTHIPLDDVLFSALKHGYVMSEEVLQRLAKEHVRSKEETNG